MDENNVNLHLTGEIPRLSCNNNRCPPPPPTLCVDDHTTTKASPREVKNLPEKIEKEVKNLPEKLEKEAKCSLSNLCPSHSKQFEIFCKKCAVLICADCVVVAHADCGKLLQHIAEAAKDCRQELDSLLARARERGVQLQQTLTLSDPQRQLQSNYELQKNKIKQAFDEIRAAASAREQAVLQQLEQRHAELSCTLAEFSVKAQADCEKLTCFATRAQVALDCDDIPLLLLKSALSAMLSVPSSLDVPDLSFRWDRDILTELSQSGLVDEGCSTIEGDSEPALFTCHDRQGRVRAAGGDHFDIELGSEANGERISVVVRDSQLAVKLGGRHLHGSPCRIRPAENVEQFERMWGERGHGQGQFRSAYGVAVSKCDEIFVAEFKNSRIQVFKPDGLFVREWGSPGHEPQQFINPGGVVVSGPEVFVLDTDNHRIQVFHSDGTFLRSWGSLGTAEGQLSRPWAAAVFEGQIFVTENTSHRVQVFDLSGSFVRTWGMQGCGQGQFKNPSGVAVWGGEVFVADCHNNRIQVFRPDGTFVRSWGSRGSGQGLLHTPHGIAVSSLGELFVADTGNARIQVFRPDGSFLRMCGSAGSGQGQLNNPTSVAIATDGRVYVTDCNNYRIQVFR